MPIFLSHAETVVSMAQLEGGEPAASHQLAQGVLTTPDAPVSEMAAGGSQLPLYSFPARSGYGAAKRVRSFGSMADAAGGAGSADSGASGSSDEDAAAPSGAATLSSAMQVVPQRSLLDALLLGEWERRAEAGLFRYDVTACPTKLVPGSYGFVAQCNEGRQAKKRPTEFSVDQVAQPFDGSKFNFKKAAQKEVLFMFEPAAQAAGGSQPAFRPAAAPLPSPNLLFINVSPIEYGHVLLVPRALDDLPQLVEPDTLLLALQLAREADNPYFRLAFNSLGAYGTINHLHFQAYYLAAPFAVERAAAVPLDAAGLGLAPAGKSGTGGRGVRVQRLVEYPVRTLVFEAGESLEELAELVGTACQRLTAANVPHNLFIADRGARIFLYPNCFAERKARGEVPEELLETQVDPAVFEISGHMVMKRQQDYDGLTQEGCWRLLELASVSEERFGQVARIALEGLI